MNSTGRKPWLAATLSLLCPGLGHVYCGRIVRGLVLFLLSLLFAPVTVIVALSPAADGLLYALVGAGVAAAVLEIFAVVDAWRIARPLRAEFAPREYQRPVVYAMFLLAGVVVPGCAAAAVTTRSFAAYRIASDSMSPTLHKGDRILANKLRFEFGPVRRGDVVVFRAPDGERTYVKRVIGLPGDRVEYKAGRVIVNGERLAVDAPPADAVDDNVRVERNGECSYTVRLRESSQPDSTSDVPDTRVPDGSFFLIGDNREASMDSRSFGAIPWRDVIGSVDYVYASSQGLRRLGAVRDQR